MKIFYEALRLLLAGAAIALLAACAETPQQRTDLDYRSRPLDSPAGSSSAANPSGQRLTIQSGEGERLNLPWFIEGAQDWVNRQ
jgi:outer membrane biogenesis lipoprotein LolB